MLISCCGNRCDECERYPGECPGCAAIGGKAEWCASLDVEVCPFVTCAAETGVSHCGECEEFPCEVLSSMGVDQGFDPTIKIEQCRKWAQEK